MAGATPITPVLRYQDADTAARWLCQAFGFQEHGRAQELNGHVRYVSLRLGEGIVLVRPIAKSVLDDLMVQPAAIGGANTQICYLAVPDVIDHHARAQGAGAKIELQPQDDGLGGRFYTCRDLEGHLWSFGTRTYGVAHETVSAFEPAELSPSLPSIPIASPQPQLPRKPVRSSRLVRDIAIAAATATLVAGGWAYYDTYAGSALRDAAASSMATAARLGDAVKQLEYERSRRSIAEAAAAEAEAKLAHERIAAARLRESLQRDGAELADMRRQKSEAMRALEAADKLSQKHRLERDSAEARIAVAKAQIAEAEAKLAQLASAEAEARAQLAKEQRSGLKEKEELQEARTALLEANKKIEELRVWQLEPMVPDRGDPVAENSACVLAVQGKIASSHKGPNTWTVANLGRLCRGAEESVEPGRCFEEIVRGKVDWGAGTTWVPSNALALCGGTRNARRTLDCFKRQVSSGQAWQVAIRQCRTR
jgi:uncharacterized glyoxalase superfamily protein PhnB